ncbi:MAG: AAA family ATPase [Candidatus Thorarchaeota archaeon]
MKLVIIFGPPAVGKMTVGKELAKLTGLKLFHNHMTIELVKNFFEYCTPKFHLLNNEFRKRIFEEVATSDLPDMIFTYVWSLKDESDKRYIDDLSKLFSEQGGDVYYIELETPLEVRLKRNTTELRLLEKPSHRDLIESRNRVIDMDKKYKLNTNNDFFYHKNYLKIYNTHLSAEEVAKLIIEKFNF